LTYLEEEMIRIYRSSIIDAAITKVWNKIRNFNALPEWHPTVADSQIEEGHASDKVGCIRNFHLKDGGNIREQLLAHSDVDHYTTYSILESPMPVTGYVATIRLREITDGSCTFIEWSAEFDTDEEAAMHDLVGDGVFQGGFDALKESLS
jgi:hypothetical protein